MIEFGETPIDKTEFARSVVNHDIVRLDISVGDTLGVAEVEGLENFKHVETNIKVSEGLVESSEVHIASIHILHDQSGSLSHGIAHNVNQVHDVHSILQSLKDLNLSSNLSLLH